MGQPWYTRHVLRSTVSPDVPRSRRVRRADNAAANYGLGLHRSAEGCHGSIHRHHAGINLNYAGRDLDLGSGVHGDPAGFQLDGVPIAIENFYGAGTILQRDLLAARCFRGELLMPVL